MRTREMKDRQFIRTVRDKIMSMEHARRCYLRLAACALSRAKKCQTSTFIQRKLLFRPKPYHINVTNFLHSNFRSVQWHARGAVNGNVPACSNWYRLSLFYVNYYCFSFQTETESCRFFEWIGRSLSRSCEQCPVQCAIWKITWLWLRDIE